MPSPEGAEVATHDRLVRDLRIAHARHDAHAASIRDLQSRLVEAVGRAEAGERGTVELRESTQVLRVQLQAAAIELEAVRGHASRLDADLAEDDRALDAAAQQADALVLKLAEAERDAETRARTRAELEEDVRRLRLETDRRAAEISTLEAKLADANAALGEQQARLDAKAKAEHRERSERNAGQPAALDAPPTAPVAGSGVDQETAAALRAKAAALDVARADVSALRAELELSDEVIASLRARLTGNEPA